MRELAYSMVLITAVSGVEVEHTYTHVGVLKPRPVSHVALPANSWIETARGSSQRAPSLCLKAFEIKRVRLYYAVSTKRTALAQHDTSEQRK